jgi:hypothetical protein
MTPPIGVVYVYRQERAAFAAELQLLLKGMWSHASSIFFTSVTDVQSVLICESGISPQKSRFEIFPWRGSPLLERRQQRQIGSTSLGL